MYSYVGVLIHLTYNIKRNVPRLNQLSLNVYLTSKPKPTIT